MGEVPDSLPVTDEARERLREQANQMPPGAVVRLIDLLAVAVDDMRQGGDPRLPLELALVKVTRPASDLSRESLAFRLERLEAGHVPAGEKPRSEKPVAATVPPSAEEDAAPAVDAASPPLHVELEQLQEAWRRSILPAVAERSIPISSALGEAHPAALAGDTLTLEFPQTAGFHLKLAEDSKNAALLRDALYEVTGRKLAVVFELGEAGVREQHDETPATEEDVLELMKSTFDARELDE
jgi:DNA polymerase III gamma/tau subunit